MKVVEQTPTSASQIQRKSASSFFGNTTEQSSPFFAGKEALNNGSFFSPTAPLSKNSPIQAKLTVGAPNDKYEYEADSMADKVVQRLSQSETIQTKATPSVSAPIVMKTAAEEDKLQKKEEEKQPEETPELQKSPISAVGDDEGLQMKCADCETEDKKHVQHKESGETAASPSIESRLSASKGGGSPLSNDTRSGMESAFGADFSGVRVHTGSEAVQMSQDLNAHAFTHGSDVYFNSGKYNPSNTEGSKLLAHELTHTVQQGATVKRKPQIEENSQEIENNPQADESNQLAEAAAPADEDKEVAQTATSNLPEQEGTSMAEVPNVESTMPTETTQTAVPEIQMQSETGTVPQIQKFDIPGSGLAKRAFKSVTSLGGRAVRAVGNIASDIGDAIGDGIQVIRDMVSSGINWISNAWSQLSNFASSVLGGIQQTFTGLTRILTAPINRIVSAVMNFDGDSLSAAWNGLTGFVQRVWQGFRATTMGLVQRVLGLWTPISNFVSSMFSRLNGLTQNVIFRNLPNALQSIGRNLIQRVQGIWQRIQNGWQALQSNIERFVRRIFDTVENFVSRLLAFSIGNVINVFRKVRSVLQAIYKVIKNPNILIDPVIDWIANRLQGTPQAAQNHITQKLNNDDANQTSSATSVIMRQDNTLTPETEKSTATMGAIWDGFTTALGEKWEKLDVIKAIKDALWTLIIPWHNLGPEWDQFKLSLSQSVAGLYRIQNFQDFLTNLLRLLDVVIIVWRFINSFLGRFYGWFLILSMLVGAAAGYVGGTIGGAIIGFFLGVAPAAPGAVVGGGLGAAAGAGAGAGFALWVGYGLFISFLAAEGVNVINSLSLLKIGLNTHAQKEKLYNNLADSTVAVVICGLLIALSAVAARIGSVILNFLKNIFVKITPYIEAFQAGLKGGLNRGQANSKAPTHGELPTGSKIVRQGEHFVVYENAQGQMRIRFRASEAVTLKEATEGRNYSTDTWAGLNEEGKPYVHEGRHRAIGAANGDTIHPDLGGVSDAPGWLDYEYSPNVESGGVPIRDLNIDYNQPDVPAAEAERIRNERFNSSPPQEEAPPQRAEPNVNPDEQLSPANTVEVARGDTRSPNQVQRAEWLDNDGGHSYRDHGAQTTEAQHQRRLETGETPGGETRATDTASRFNSDASQMRAYREAYTRFQNLKYNSRGGYKIKVEVEFSMQEVGVSYTLDATGNLIATSANSVKAVFRLDPATGRYHLVTMYPL